MRCWVENWLQSVNLVSNDSHALLVCYTAVFSVVTQRGALRDDTENGCVAD